jgi:hypothetical protein
MFDPVLYKNPLFANADGMVLFCKELLEKKGLTTEATKLAGYYGINDEETAQAAHEALMHVRVPNDRNIREYIKLTKELLLKAAGTVPLRQAS